jgi:gluconokinase
MPHVPGLRSPYAKVGRLIYFGRMLDKIRLQAAGKLPPEYVANVGEGKPTNHDLRCSRFLGVPHEEIRQRTLAGGSDAEILAWAHARGTPRSDEDCHTWNNYMMKVGWRDDRSALLAQRIRDAGWADQGLATSFDFIEKDEGRQPLAGRPWELRDSLVIVLMGVSGTGKTTVGEKLSAALGWSFRDADDFHPPANVKKMSEGHPLTDADRAPWLAAIRNYIQEILTRGENAIVTCSALKESYRQQIVPNPARVKLVFLQGDFNLLKHRMEERPGHFMKADMLQSQFATLEPPQHALTLDVAEPPDTLVGKIRQAFGLA